MAESNLGTAVLALRVDTDSALQALAAFRKEALAAFSGLNTGNPFDGFGRGAASAGRRVGRWLRKGVEDELKQQLDDQLSKQRQLLQLESERTEAARKRLAAEAKERRSREEGRGREIGRLNAVGIDGRLPGGTFAPGSPGALAARRKRLSEAGANALIGGAFPALFGQGLGASVGGALGGGAGGLVGGQFGFGLSLVGTALGSQFDIATQKLQTLGEALSDPVKQFSALTEAGLISSKGLEKQIQALIDTGRQAEAAALIQQDLASSYGDLQGAKELAAASDELNRSWAKLQATTASLVGLPLVSLLSDTSSALLVFAEAISKLKNIIPKPVADAGGNFLKQFALGGLLPGVKTVQDAAKFIPGSQEISGFFGGLLSGGNNELTQQNDQLNAAKQNYGDLNTLAYQLVTAQAQGNKELEIGLRKRQIELQLQRDSATLNESNDPGGVRRQSLIDKAKQDAFALDEQLKSLTNGSLTDLQEKLAQLKGQRVRVPVDSIEFKELVSEIDKLEKRIKDLTRKRGQEGSFFELEGQLRQLQDLQGLVSVGSSAFKSLDREIVQVTDDLRKLEKQAAEIRFDTIADKLKSGEISASFKNLRDQLSAAEEILENVDFTPQLVAAKQLGEGFKINLDYTAVREAVDKVLEAENALDRLDGKKAIITVEQINAGVQDGSLTNNFSNLEKRSQAAQQALNSAAFGSPEFDKALRAAQSANFELDQRRKAADPAAFSKALEDAKKAQEDAAKGVADAFAKLEQASDSLAQAQKAFRSALEGAFDFLTPGNQKGLLKGAKEDVQRAVNAGFFDPSKVSGLKGKELLSAAQQARAVLDSSDNLSKSQSQLTDATYALEKATSALAEKDWAVNVAVNANSGDYAVNLG